MTFLWEIWIDVGGTFTDCIGRAPDGSLRVHKLLSTGTYHGSIGIGSDAGTILDPQRIGDPDRFFEGWEVEFAALATPTGETPRSHRTVVTHFEARSGILRLANPLPVPLPTGQRYTLRSPNEAPVTGVRWLMGKGLHESTGRIRVRLGTTRATNALLERQGARTAFVTTAGFRDVLRIACQNRPNLFDLNIRKPQDLYETSIELNERLTAQGDVLCPLDPAEVRTQLAALKDGGIQSLAVCLLHSYRNPAHELAVGNLARELGFSHISLSSQTSPLPKIVVRGDTTVVDAYLTPVIRDYVDRIAAQLPEADLQLMTSSGSLVSARSFHGKDAILSGPAGGVVGAARVAGLNGISHMIGFDMGGTSTDVSRFDGEYERRYEMEVKDPVSDGAIRVTAPMLAVETVAAGGGSICWFDGQKPVVGPRSAAADPGPACYGRGGPLTVTDVNLFLGRIVPDRFPFPLNQDAVIHRLDELIRQIQETTSKLYERTELAAGFIAIANANMAAPIRRVSLARGYDVRTYALVSFGGAGSQHACAIACELGMNRILCPAHAGVLSALGIGLADTTKFAERSVGHELQECQLEMDGLFQSLEQDLRRELTQEGFAPEQIQPPREFLDLRYFGQEARITVARPADGNWRAAFELLHRQLYGFKFPDRRLEVYAARVELTASSPRRAQKRITPVPRRPEADRTDHVWLDGKSRPVGIHWREQLHAGDTIAGPALIAEAIATIVVESGWTAEVTALNDVTITRTGKHSSHDEQAEAPPDAYATADPIELELFNNHFASIAEQMGTTLQRTALSTNVKERLDFSCAVFTETGDLVVNAPHIPVHLGAMSECVKCLLEDVPEMQPGEIYVTNDPYRGGSHLPDVTVITPVFLDAVTTLPGDAKLIRSPQFFVASRAHHAEIGGITPGSMPPFSTSLAEEGVLIRAFRLARNDQSSEQELRKLLADAPHPSRSPDENIADINAQAAANQMGVLRLGEMVARHSFEKVRAYMQHIQNAAAQKLRTALLKIPEGRHCFTDSLDDGSPISVAISISHGMDPNGTQAGATVDFTGTGPVLSGNLNANRAIVTSAVIYCFRCLIHEPIPLNAGVLAPITLLIPDPCLLNPTAAPDPAACPAMVGGNVETSQRVVDVVLGALQLAAASQGTMNNFLFGRSGDRAFGYYETICGGSGATPQSPGTDAVHTHMTNTRLTDPEVLESRYPVRLLRCEIRRGSGGKGKHAGGNGLVRELEFLEPVEVSLLTSRRTTNSFGLAGGGGGEPGHNEYLPPGERIYQQLPPSTRLIVGKGDRLRLTTPGGGGWGESPA